MAEPYECPMLAASAMATMSAIEWTDAIGIQLLMHQDQRRL